jgi:hypothetical protein
MFPLIGSLNSILGVSRPYKRVDVRVYDRHAMQRTLYLVLAILVLPCGCPAQGVDFITTAEINQVSLNTSFYKQHGRFYADVSVRNVSGLPQKITVWTNPSWSWVTDSKKVTTSQEAAQNVPSIVMLKPGEIYKSSIEMTTNPNGKRPITFRLGFIPNAKRPAQNTQDPKLIWSNLVMLAQVATTKRASRIGDKEEKFQPIPYLKSIAVICSP